MHKLLIVLSSMLLSSVLTWLLFVAIYKPSPNDFLVRTTSHYFQTMSEKGYASSARYQDCKLEVPDKGDIRQGVEMFGLCSAELSDIKIYYMLAMSPTSQIQFYDFEVQQN